MSGRPPPVRYTLRPMALGDVGQVAGIARASFAKPWSEASFRHEIDVPFSRPCVAHPAGAPDHVVGYVVAWSVADEVHLLDLAVDVEARRGGIGRLLVERVLAEARARAARLVTLEVAEENEPARRLYAQLGFLPVLVRRDYYGPGHDAVVMERALAGA